MSTKREDSITAYKYNINVLEGIELQLVFMSRRTILSSRLNDFVFKPSLSFGKLDAVYGGCARVIFTANTDPTDSDPTD